MKKFLKALTAVLAVVVLAVTLVGCGDKYGKIKKAYEDEGYSITEVTASENEEKLKAIGMSNEQFEDIKNNNIMLASKGLNVAFVISFTATDELKDYCSKKSAEYYQKMVDEGYVNGNCLLLTISPAAKEIFKNA